MTASLVTNLLNHSTQFLRWWLGELADLWSLLPIKGHTRRRYSHIYLEADRVIVDRRIGPQVDRFVEQRAFDALGADGQSELQELTNGAPATLLLSSPDIYSISLSLPAIARSRLTSAVSLQMPIIAPLKPDLLSWSITAVRRETNQLQVDIVMAKRATLDGLRAISEEISADSWAIAPAHAPEHPFKDYEGARRTPSAWAKELRWVGLAVLALCSIPFTIIVAGALLTARADGQADRLRDQATEKRSAIQTAVRLEDQRRAAAPLFGQADAATLLNELAERLPPSDWLRSLERRPSGAISFTVSTGDEAALDAALRQSDLLPGVHVSDQTPAADGHSDVTYETDPR